MLGPGGRPGTGERVGERVSGRGRWGEGERRRGKVGWVGLDSI